MHGVSHPHRPSGAHKLRSAIRLAPGASLADMRPWATARDMAGRVRQFLGASARRECRCWEAADSTERHKINPTLATQRLVWNETVHRASPAVGRRILPTPRRSSTTRRTWDHTRPSTRAGSSSHERSRCSKRLPFATRPKLEKQRRNRDARDVISRTPTWSVLRLRARLWQCQGLLTHPLFQSVPSWPHPNILEADNVLLPDARDWRPRSPRLTSKKHLARQTAERH